MAPRGFVTICLICDTLHNKMRTKLVLWHVFNANGSKIDPTDPLSAFLLANRPAKESEKREFTSCQSLTDCLLRGESDHQRHCFVSLWVSVFSHAHKHTARLQCILYSVKSWHTRWFRMLPKENPGTFICLNTLKSSMYNETKRNFCP